MSPASNQESAQDPVNELEKLIEQVTGSNVVGVGTQPRDMVKIMLPVVRAITQLNTSLIASERTNSKLSRRLICLTWVLVVLTAVIAWFTIKLAVHH